MEEICDSLSRTIPEHGILYTADTQFWGQMVRNAEKVGARVELSRPADDLPNFDFPENVALALAVCGELGVDREGDFKLSAGPICPFGVPASPRGSIYQRHGSQ